MKIERISENSIRCTLTGFDLSVRNLNIRELAYGSEKARKLFNEMMIKASNEVGFDAENTPIMIEAIPLNGDSIQLVITKVEDPEELDTRFSKFSPMPKGSSEDWVKRLTSEFLEGATNGLLRQLQQLGAGGASNALPKQGETASDGSQKQQAPAAPEELPYRVFAFDSLDRIIDAARASADYAGCSTLYKKPDGEFILVVESNETTEDNFAKLCNIIAEYGRKVKAAPAAAAYYDEHYEKFIPNCALQKLSRI